MAAAGTKQRRKKLEQLEIREVSGLKALADPIRLHILIELHDQPRTVKEVASILDVKPTRLYYHFNILERAGLIRVVDKRMVSGIEERSYESVAESTTVAPEIVPKGVKKGVVGALLNVVRAELELALLSGPTTIGDPESAVPMLALTGLLLTKQEVEELQQRLIGVMQDFGEQGEPQKGERRYHAILAAYLAPSELRRTETTPL